ncbi:hypothetical protein EPO05_00635 [Patescibacteria group bacterium]|nr:MAG: hypothetical protein EPO05_00635 [Patescibacteria group bacterium]
MFPVNTLFAAGECIIKPVVGNWNNADVKSKIGIFADATWNLDFNGNFVPDAHPTDKIASFGVAGDIPITGDWNGDGITEIGTYKGGKWQLDIDNDYTLDNSTTEKLPQLFGTSVGDVPVTGDWNGDGTTDLGIFRSGKWYLDLNNSYSYNAGDRYVASFVIDATSLCKKNLGPEISVGLWKYIASDLKSASTFQVDANKDYIIKDKDGVKIAQVVGTLPSKINYVSDQNFKIRYSIPDKLLNKEISFEAADGDNSTMVFNVHRPLSDYDQYRGKVKIRFTDSNNIWVINALPLEQYTWGMGETTGTGNINHTKVMTSIFRTYGQWYIKYATKYAPYGFKIRSDSGSQIYKGYQWETAHPNIKIAAEATNGIVATYDSDVALTPYSSWSDGRTRSFQERWGSTAYPWCKSVSDPYGKHATMTTAQLEAAGNHMVGLVANGSVKLAANYGWDWQKIMKYYYTGISLKANY